MKTIEFTYTKADGSVSTRMLVPVITPANYYEGIDVSQMPNDEFAAFAVAYSELREKQIKELQALQEGFDLKHNYRRFLTERMSNIVVN